MEPEEETESTASGRSRRAAMLRVVMIGVFQPIDFVSLANSDRGGPQIFVFPHQSAEDNIGSQNVMTRRIAARLG
jgi:hypothetical protein